MEEESMKHISIFAVIFLLMFTSCTLPTGPSPNDLTAQSLRKTQTAMAIPTDTPTLPPEVGVAPDLEAACDPTVIATTDVNVRGGPSTDYPIHGYLPTGTSANVAGRNGDSTWWYIAFTGAPGGYAWVWGGGVTPDCIPGALQVVAAEPPPAPQAPPANPQPDQPTPTPSPTDSQFAIGTMMFVVTLSLPEAQGDIVLQSIFLSSGGEILVRVAVSPSGSLSGNVQYKVWVDGSQIATISQALPTGSMVYWTGHTISGNHDVKVRLDSNGAFWETDETNNEFTVTCNGLSCH
jgi:hypothetical protein